MAPQITWTSTFPVKYILLLNKIPPSENIRSLLRGILFSQNFYTKKSLKSKNLKNQDVLIQGVGFYLRGDFIKQENVYQTQKVNKYIFLLNKIPPP